MSPTRTAKRGNATGSRRKRSAAGRSAKIEVSAQERTHLIEDIAYFHAERFRQVEGAGCRDEDRQEAKTEIEAVLRRGRKR